ncbi:ribonuclease P protein component [Gynuella sunshinyii]|uniref:Ribonuclease P protein component n=1 Tax=Gynuella sunshinyii YC6258 TaxID=1445510 RepID=A0A0C5VEL1_9GAMM|nr:ribonuclease P protein component [Gynuella sunshinyii]AJQ92641.1 RNase P protein component [Gynuella sunshinyii YC6258]
MGSCEFTRQQRLLTAKDFRRVFDLTQSRAACPELLFLARTNDLPANRLGFIIAKKNVKRAVNRNLIKRIIREEFRLKPHSPTSIDIVVLARKGADKLDRKALHNITRKMFKKLDKRLQESAV